MMRRNYDFALPIRPFFYTVDQIATLTALPVDQVRAQMFKVGVSTGLPKREQLQSINLGTPMVPEWRIEEKELRRWLRHRGYRVMTTW